MLSFGDLSDNEVKNWPEEKRKHEWTKEIHLISASTDFPAHPHTPSYLKIRSILTDQPQPEYNSFDSDPWILKLVDFTRKLLETQSRIRILGICFGHQIVGRALGAKVARGEQGWEVSVTPLELTSLGKDIFGVDTLVSFRIPPLPIPPSAHFPFQLNTETDLATRASTKCIKTLFTTTPPAHYL